MTGQIDASFTTVPVVNGKVVFEQFLLTDQGISSNQKYAILQKWIRDKYTGSPLVSEYPFRRQKPIRHGKCKNRVGRCVRENSDELPVRPLGGQCRMRTGGKGYYLQNTGTGSIVFPEDRYGGANHYRPGSGRFGRRGANEE